MRPRFETLQKTPLVIQERSDDKEAEDFISSKIDVESLVANLTSKIFRVKTKEIHDKSRTHREAKRLILAMARLVYELKDKALDYDSMIGDDVSGRLPSLVLIKIINKKREEQGLDPIPLFFVAGGNAPYLGDTFMDPTEAQHSSIRKFLKKKRKNKGLGNKTLVSTEFIKRGHGIRWLLEEMKKLNIEYDVSSVSIDPKFKIGKDGEDPLSGKLIFGTKGDEGSYLHAKDGVGVAKPLGDWMEGRNNPHSVIETPWERKERVRDRKEISAARHDVALIAEELYKILET